jgi:MOSC domain-containing protein YiiM
MTQQIEQTAVIESLYVGSSDLLEKVARESLTFTFEGIVGDKHAGFTKAADGRNPEYPRGTPMRNDRQWSAVAVEEMQQIAEHLGITELNPGWIGANIAFRGLHPFTLLPRGTRLFFPCGAVLRVEDTNNPCSGPGKVLSSKYPELHLKPNLFPKAAMHRRGLVGVVERPGVVTVGDAVRIEVYEPRPYPLPQA